MKRRIGVFILCLAALTNCFAQTQVPPKRGEAGGNAGSVLEKMPRSLETRFALSALPPSLREKAAVYVLDPAKGYVLHRAGSNGQSCFVVRTEWRWEEYHDDIYTPICYDSNSAGAKSQMRLRFDVAELMAKGISPQNLKKEIENRVADRAYQAPHRAGLSCMTAPLMRTYVSLGPPDKTVMTMTMPHVMYYAPDVTDGDIGGIPPLSPYPFVFERWPLGYMIQRLGDREATKIVASESVLLKDLCSYRSYLCLTTEDSRHPASEHSR